VCVDRSLLCVERSFVCIVLIDLSCGGIGLFCVLKGLL